MSIKNKLHSRIQDRSAVVAIYGLGYVGLPLALRFIDEGYKVIGFDTDPEKVEKLNSGRTYIERISDEVISSAVSKGFWATSDYENTDQADALIICVPTPLGKHNDPDLSYVIDTVQGICPFLKKGQVVCLESTTYPGTTEEELLPRIEAQGFSVGEDIFLVYSPEREDPGNPDFSTQTIPKVCGGHTEACLDIGQALYGMVIDKIVAVSSTKTAEMTKLLENIYRAVNIGLVNELKIVSDKMDIDIFEVINAAATKPFGFVPFYPGPGLGGHCIPIDPFYLTWKAKELGVKTDFIRLAGEINTFMPEYVIGKVISTLNAKGESVNNSSILILGLAYKKNVDDTRESPSLLIMDLLMKMGANVDYSDPYVPVFPNTRKFKFDMQSKDLSPENLSKYNLVLLLTDHDSFDYDQILDSANVLIDTRGRYRGNKSPKLFFA